MPVPVPVPGEVTVDAIKAERAALQSSIARELETLRLSAPPDSSADGGECLGGVLGDVTVLAFAVGYVKATLDGYVVKYERLLK